MPDIKALFKLSTNDFIPILENGLLRKQYVPVDLSIYNTDLNRFDITKTDECQAYIDSVIGTTGKIAFGGYLEKRNLYNNNSKFDATDDNARNIHLGVDFWAPTNTKVLVPVEGVVHSFKNNTTLGDYGPTIILKHNLNGVIFYSLYGHLSIASLDKLFVGKQFSQGDTLATLGAKDINVGYAPHLHFQIILDIDTYLGDYPGVTSSKDLDFYTNNCPDPNFLLKI